MKVSDIGKALGASRTIRLPRAPRDPLDAVMLIRIVQAEIQPSQGQRPGRPTNEAWTLRRQIPFREETWSMLQAFANQLSTPERKVSPGQLAATILEQVLHAAPPSAGVEEVDEPTPAAVGAR